MKMSENEYKINKIEIKVKNDYILIAPMIHTILSNIDDITVILNEMDEYKLVKTKDPENIIIEHAKEYELAMEHQLQTTLFKEWTPLNLLIHIWRFYDMQKKDCHYFDDKFQELMKNVETYLKGYKSRKTKWQHVIPETEETATKYRRIFEDDIIIVKLGEETLQVITKHDDFAYDIPLKLFLEYYKFMVDCNKCTFFDKDGWDGKICSECRFNPAFKNHYFETEN